MIFRKAYKSIQTEVQHQSINKEENTDSETKIKDLWCIFSTIKT